MVRKPVLERYGAKCFGPALYFKGILNRLAAVWLLDGLYVSESFDGDLNSIKKPNATRTVENPFRIESEPETVCSVSRLNGLSGKMGVKPILVPRAVLGCLALHIWLVW